jgi:predicted short-subunit dehydrogenase-like oxidoreductase (DUF2520 family)
LAAAGHEVELLPGRGLLAALHGRDRAHQRDVLFLAVPDPALPAVAAELAASTLDARTAVVHVSGAFGLDVLAPLSRAGFAVGAFHPLQSFPVERPPAAFHGSLVALAAGAPELEERLATLALELGARPRHVGDAQRTPYHAAAVMASNYLVALAGEAVAVLHAAGWSREEALTDLLPLMDGVLANLRAAGLPAALIGPIRRGDPATVERHLAALGAAGGQPGPLVERVYRILGLAALELALEAGLDPGAAEQIRTALTGPPAATGR